MIQNHNYKIYNDAKILNDNGINIYTLKTDAFTIEQDDERAVKILLKFDSNIGNWRISKTSDIIFLDKHISMKMNNEMPIKLYQINNIEIPNEYDSEYICKTFEQYKNVRNLGSVPGL